MEKHSNMNMPAQDDLYLLQSIQKGNRKAFDHLFRMYYPVLCTYCQHYVEPEEAKEIVQDTMLWLWEKRETLAGIQSPKHYLFTTVYHRAIRHLEQNEMRRQAHATYHERTMTLLEDIDICLLNDLSHHIRTALAQLPPAQREVFLMNRFRDMTYEEISKQLNISPQTVAYRIRQALAFLKEELKDYFPLALLMLDMKLIF